MAVVTLTFIRSETEISSGIPESVTIESNIPATIYFTIDGSSPTPDSPIYIDGVVLPTGFNSITLSAFGVDSEDEVGPTLTQTFAPDVTSINVARFISAEGIVQDRANSGFDLITGFDADGLPARFLDVDPSEYDFIESEREADGTELGLLVEVNIPDENTNPTFEDNNFQPFSTPEKAEFFNPTARMIVIDNRIDNDVKLMPRPFGSLSNIYKEFGGKRLRDPQATYVSGGFVRRFYSPKTNTMVGYYFDHNEGRYVKNIQTLPSNIFMLTGSFYTIPLVFKWLGRDGRQTSF